MTMKPVILETPYAGDVPLHLRYLRACMRHCLANGNAPFASHHLYTAPGVLRDEVPGEREAGIEAGFAWRQLAVLTVFYTDLGWSSGMVRGREACERAKHPYEERQLGPGWIYEQRAREHVGDALTHWLQSMAPVGGP